MAARHPSPRRRTPSRSSRSPRPTRRSRPIPCCWSPALALVSSDAEAQEALAPFRGNPALDRALMVLDAVPTTIADQRKRQIEDNPEGHRWAVDNAWLSGPAAEVVPAMRRAYTTLPHAKAFTIWFSMAPLRAAARHGVLAPVRDLPGVVRLLGRRVRRRALPGLARRRDDRPRAGHRRPVPRRLATCPAARSSSCPTRAGRGCSRSAPSATRTGCSSATSPAPVARRTATTGLAAGGVPGDQGTPPTQPN